MQDWIKATLMLCVFGFVKEIRPSEPFIFEYLTGDWTDVTSEQVVNDIYPYSIYSSIFILVITFFITDVFCYKPVMTLLALSGITGWSLIIWKTNLIGLKFSQAWYGIFLATEVAYFTYIYAKVEKKLYTRVTAYTRAAVMAGTTFSYVFAGISVVKDLLNLLTLNYITLGAMVVATVWSLYLPSVPQKIDFDYIWKTDKNAIIKFGKVIKLLITNYFVPSYTNIKIIKWSLWWILTTIGYLLVGSTVLKLWFSMAKTKDDQFFELVIETMAAFTSFLCTLIAGFVKIEWESKGDRIISLMTLLEGVTVLICARTTSMHISYMCYIVYCGLYNFVLTVSSAEIAKNVKDTGFGQIFSFNTLICLIAHFIAVSIFANTKIGLGLNPRVQFSIYGYYHMTIFLFVAIVSFFFKNCTTVMWGSIV